jgi:hypothetical protein
MSLWDELPSLAEAARRPLPAEDPAVLALDAAGRAKVAAVWAERAESELGAGAVFAAVARGLFGEGVSHQVVWLASRAVCDEMRHSEICRHVAAVYGGAVPERPALRDVAPPPLGASAHAVLICAINETIGSAFLSACLDEAEGALPRAALRELLADETDHARIGWAVLAGAPEGGEARREVARRLREMVLAARDAWRLRASELPEELPRGHGCLPRGDVLAVVDEAIRSLVLPGLARVGGREAAGAIGALEREIGC